MFPLGHDIIHNNCYLSLDYKRSSLFVFVCLPREDNFEVERIDVRHDGRVVSESISDDANRRNFGVIRIGFGVDVVVDRVVRVVLRSDASAPAIRGVDPRPSLGC
jgi:hypothetical protein